MLLRSSSSPILNTWSALTKGSSPEPNLIPPLQRTHLPPSMSLKSSSSGEESSWVLSRKLPRAVSETDLRDLAARKLKPLAQSSKRLPSQSVEEGEEERSIDSFSSSLLLSSSGLNESVENAEGCSVGLSGTLFSGDGFGSIGGGGGICGGGGRGGSDVGDGEGGSGFSDSNRGNNSTDAYYQKMIEADPGNALLLSNYAMFLKEVGRKT